MTIHFIGETLAPADNTAQAGPTVTLSTSTGALASAQVGDLIVVDLVYRANGGSEDLLVNGAGGQAWSWWRIASNTNIVSRRFWCRFNGAWLGALTFSHYTDQDASQAPTGALPISAYAVVFRPTNSGKYWVPRLGPLVGTFAAGGSPFTKTITGVTTVSAYGSQSYVVVAGWYTPDANTWGALAGTNWTKAGLSDQQRNASGSFTSATLAYQIQEAAAATNDVSQDQLTLGGDAGATCITAFVEIDLPSAGTSATLALGDTAIGGDNSSAANVAATITAVPSGDSVIGGCHFETAAGAYLTTVSDNQSNAYIPLLYAHHQFLEQGVVLFYRPNITNAPTTVTASFNVAEIARGIALHTVDGGIEWDVGAGYYWDALDGGSPEPLTTTPAILPRAYGEYLFGFICNSNAPRDTGWFAATGGWTLREEKGSIGSSINAAASFDQLQATRASVALTVTADLGDNHVMMMGAFLPAAVAVADFVGARSSSLKAQPMIRGPF